MGLRFSFVIEGASALGNPESMEPLSAAIGMDRHVACLRLLAMTGVWQVVLVIWTMIVSGLRPL